MDLEYLLARQLYDTGRTSDEDIAEAVKLLLFLVRASSFRLDG